MGILLQEQGEFRRSPLPWRTGGIIRHTAYVLPREKDGILVRRNPFKQPGNLVTAQEIPEEIRPVLVAVLLREHFVQKCLHLRIPPGIIQDGKLPSS